MSRYPDRDSRPPLPRERSPVSRSYRPAGPYNPNFSSRPNDFNRPYHDAREPPRGPRGVNDIPGRPAPTAPRGRGGFVGRSDSRDSGFGSDRFHDGGDRYDGRRRSPIPSRRESQTFPRDIPRQLDTDRARQESRDGPPSAGSNPPDNGFRGSGPPFRGGYRGRADFFRDRARIDDRSRARSRSRERRDRSVDSRDLDRRERQRDNNERSYIRDRDDRDLFPGRRVEPPQRVDTRPSGDIRGPSAQSTTQNERPPVLHATPPDRAVGDFRRDFDPSRRGSALSDHIRDSRRDVDRVDPNAGRPDSQRAARPVSPPPPSSVPSFGFRAPPSFAGVTSLSWKNPDLAKPPPASGPAQPTKAAPTAPKALSIAPPTAPKAERTLEKTPSKESLIAVEDISKERGLSVGASPSPRLALGVLQDVSQQPKFSPAVAAGFLNPPSAPRAMTSPQPLFGRPTGPGGFGRATSPTSNTSIPTGPKVTGPINASPRILSSVIPTGPRAERGPPPSGPRNAAAPPKLFKSNSQTFPRTSVVPSKRDVDGYERERSLSNEARLGDATSQGASSIQELDHGPVLLTAHTDIAAVKQEAMAVDAPQQDVDMADVPTAGQNVSPTIPDGLNAFHHLTDDDDDDDMFDIAEILEIKEKNLISDKNRVEAKRVDLSTSAFRPMLVFNELSRLVAMRAMVNDLSYRSRAPVDKKESVVKAKELQQPVIAPIEFPTPQEEDQDQVMSDAYSTRESSIDRMSTPDPESLPYLEKGPPTPLSDPDPFSIVKREIPENDIISLLKSDIDAEAVEQARLEHEYRVLYMEWKKQAIVLDHEREEVERVAKQCSPESVAAPATATEAPVPPLVTPTEGGRRAHKFASEYEFQRIIEISLREEEEKKQKEIALREAQFSAAADREAAIPALLPPNEAKRRIFEDVSQARRPEDALRIFEFVPPVDDFTEEEDRIMRDVYKEYTKVWGRIAKVVRRTYKECINHYYASKWDRPYKSRVGGKRGRAARGRGKPPGGRQRSALVPAEDAAEVDPNGAPMVTESGRPKRAAAPTWPKGSDQEQNISAAAIAKRTGKDSDTGTDKPGRRKAKEKIPKKATRNQPLAARPTASPQKVDREVKDKLVQQAMELDDSWLVKAPGMVRPTEPMPPLMPQPHIFPDANISVYREVADMGAGGGPTERPRSHSNTTQRQGASSYWSVTEEHDFERCLEHYGTDFQAISNHMGTKTHTMVSDAYGIKVFRSTDGLQIKNHYQKFVNDGKHSDLIHRANEATQRRSRSEDMGPPPIPSLAPKRHGRYDTSTTPLPRSLAPSNELADAEQSPPMPVAVPFGMPPQFGAHSSIAQPVSRSSAALATTAPGLQSVGPMMGFFRDDRPSQSPANTIRPIIAPPDEPRGPRGPERIKTEFRPAADQEREILAKQERERERQEIMRRQNEIEVRTAQLAAERRDMFQRSSHAGHTPHSSIHGVASAPEHVRQDSRQHINLFGAPMANSAVHANRNVTVDLTGPQAAQLPGSLDRRPQSPIRHPAQSQHTQQPQPPPAAPSPAPASAAPKEAPRRSNLMSLLNSEPEQEKPKRRELEQPQAQQYRIPPSVQSETPPSSASARDSMVDRPFSRTTYHPAVHPTSSMSTPTNESGGRDSLPPMAHRDSWPGRQAPFHQTNSPGLHPQHAPPGPDRPPLFSRDYRASAFAGLNGPNRANPSPPPAAAYQQHSRTPSYTHAQHPTPTSSAPLVPPTSVHGNPYVQKEALAPGHSPHLPAQHHPPPTSRADFGYPQQRLQETREALLDRFRERERESADYAAAREREVREREREAARAQHDYEGRLAAHHRGYGHHTPPINQPRFPTPQAMPERNTATPLAHAGYPPPQDVHSVQMQRQFDIQQELQRREYERERSRQSRIQHAAAEADELQRRARADAEMRRMQEHNYRRPDERYPGIPPR
jgi:serine/arginine repetitive matrix protein 2